jgi:hypothetical protein
MSPVSGGAGEGRTMQYNHEAPGGGGSCRACMAQGGVRQVIENIIAELDLTMACSANIAGLSADLLVPAP